MNNTIESQQFDDNDNRSVDKALRELIWDIVENTSIIDAVTNKNISQQLDQLRVLILQEEESRSNIQQTEKSILNLIEVIFEYLWKETLKHNEYIHQSQEVWKLSDSAEQYKKIKQWLLLVKETILTAQVQRAKTTYNMTSSAELIHTYNRIQHSLNTLWIVWNRILKILKRIYSNAWIELPQ